RIWSSVSITSLVTLLAFPFTTTAIRPAAPGESEPLCKGSAASRPAMARRRITNDYRRLPHHRCVAALQESSNAARVFWKFSCARVDPEPMLHHSAPNGAEVFELSGRRGSYFGKATRIASNGLTRRRGPSGFRWWRARHPWRNRARDGRALGWEHIS